MIVSTDTDAIPTGAVAADSDAIGVLIVGAGPTGLVTALTLARWGVACRVIDRASAPSQYSKALVVHARTLEAMDLMGLADIFVARGYTMSGVELGSDSDHPIRAAMSRLNTRFPYMLVLPQVETEEILETHLRTHGIVVERETELLDVTPHDDAVIAHVRVTGGGDEANRAIRARYVVGCDGAHSAVRHAVGLPFTGHGYGWTAFLADVKIAGDYPKGGLWQFSSPRGVALVAPFRDGYFRVITIDAAYSRGPHTLHTTDLTLAELQESVNAIIPTKPTLTEPRWITRWGAQLRQVPAYRVGRVFLAGDAAHVHSPAGGQGLNTGMQDGFNLAWKLAFVLRGQAPNTLLDSYDAERAPVGRQVLRTSDLILRSMLIRNKALRAIREAALRVLTPLPPVQRLLTENLSGISIAYHPATRTVGKRVGRGAVRAGDRVSDLELAHPTDAARPFVRLYELLRDPVYTLFVVAAPAQLHRDRSDLDRLVRSIRARAGDAVRCYVVLAEGVPNEVADIGTPVLVDFKQQFRRKLGAMHGHVLLVRPDGYVAFHLRGFALPAMEAALADWAVLHRAETPG